MSDDAQPSKIGYRKPPINSRFKAGQSGNPKGRPRGSKNLDTVLMKELNTKVAITENGERKKISKCEAIGRQLVNKAASGDPKFVPILLAEARRIEDKRETGHASYAFLKTQEDALVLESIISRMKRTLKEDESK